MGGEWGVSSSLVMESVPEKWRGLASGILQAGYPSGYLLASLLYLAMPWLGWRGLFMVGILPAMLAFYVRRSVSESPAWQSFTDEDRKVGLWPVLRRNAGLAGFAVILMMTMNFFAHGSEDLYPSQFLGAQHKLSTDAISSIMIVANIGGLFGGILFGLLSEKIGRKWAMALACGLALPVLPFWASASTPVMFSLTAFLMMVCVQGVWGIVPAYLNELSPPSVRATFPGFVYQAGNFLAAANANIQIWLAGHLNNNYGLTLALTAGTMAIILVLLVVSGPEPKGARMAAKSRISPSGNNSTGTLVASVR